MKIAFGLPGAVMALLAAAALVGSLVDEHPLWPQPDPPLNLSEHAVVQGHADVVRMILLGENPNREHLIRKDLLTSFSVRLTPLEAAVAANDGSMVGTLMAYGGFVDAAKWNLLHCVARSDEIREMLRTYAPKDAVARCEGVQGPWERGQ
jgi:hypothetical protein